MAIQWVTFGVMILIQAIAATAVVVSIRTTLVNHGEQLKDHESRVRHLENPKRFAADVS